MLKRYHEFVKESFDNSFGEWIETLFDDEYIQNIVLRFTKDIDPSIRLANAVNILDDGIKRDIKTQVDEYLKKGIITRDVEVDATVQLYESNQETISLAGKGIFHSFLKSLTALGNKDIKNDVENCPNNYLFFYSCSSSIIDVKTIFNRFRSLVKYVDGIDVDVVNLYFGIKSNGQLQYGISYLDIVKPIGDFKLSKTNIKWILSLDSKSIFNFKKDIINISHKNILLFGKIKEDMNSFKPSYYEKKAYPFLIDDVITFGYYGFGEWQNGKLNSDILEELKETFNKWVISQKWGKKVLININAKSFWVYINIKIK